MPADLVPFNQLCLLNHWKPKRKPLHQTCQLTLWNPIRHVCCYLANVTYILAGPVPLLVESCLICRCSCNKYTCCPSATGTSTAAAFKIPTGWVLLQDGRLLDRCYSISMPADLLPLNPACILVCCFYIWHTCACWFGVSLSAMPADVVSL